MNTFLTANIGDHLCTLFPSVPLPDKGEMMSQAGLEASTEYHLLFVDTTTGEQYTKKVKGENDAIMFFSVWLSADEEDHGTLQKYIDELRNEEGMKPFLP